MISFDYKTGSRNFSAFRLLHIIYNPIINNICRSRNISGSDMHSYVLLSQIYNVPVSSGHGLLLTMLLIVNGEDTDH